MQALDLSISIQREELLILLLNLHPSSPPCILLETMYVLYSLIFI